MELRAVLGHACRRAGDPRGITASSYITMAYSCMLFLLAAEGSPDVVILVFEAYQMR